MRRNLTLWERFTSPLREDEEDETAREELKTVYSLEQSPRARRQHSIILTGMFIGCIISIIAIVVFSLINRYQLGSNEMLALVGLGTAFVTVLLALAAATLGILQWRAARNEISLDTFYRRLEVTNAFLDKYEEVRDFAGPWVDDMGQPCKYSHDDDSCKRYRRTMYIYLELDNLEYAIAKYKIGFMSPSNARRAVRTFQARCTESATFCDIVRKCTAHTVGYDDATVQVAKKCVEHANSNRGHQAASVPPCGQKHIVAGHSGR